MSENSRYWSRGCQIGPSVKVNPPASRSTGASGSISSENSRRIAEWRIECLRASGREPLPPRQGLDDRPGNAVLQPADDVPGLDERRTVVDRQHETRTGDDLFDCGFLLALRGAVVSGDARLHIADLAEGFDQLVVDVVEHVAADRCDPFVGLDDDVH